MAMICYSASILQAPSWVSYLSHGGRQVLFYTFFKIGGLPVTPVFLIKVTIFLFLLVAISNGVQRFILGRVLRHFKIADAQKFAFGRFTTYLFFAARAVRWAAVAGRESKLAGGLWRSCSSRRRTGLAECSLELCGGADSANRAADPNGRPDRDGQHAGRCGEDRGSVYVGADKRQRDHHCAEQ